jgi:hypothetical protein
MKAREKVDEILEKQKGPGISSNIEAELKKYHKKIAARTYDDFRKAEGMEGSETPQGITSLEG